MAIVGVIPAAGYGTRLGALSCSKEVIPIGGRPVMDYLVERLRAAPCSEIRVVTRPEKIDVIRYADRQRAVVVEAHPESSAQSIAAGLAGLADADVVLFGFPDSLWEPVSGFRSLVPLVKGGAEVALGLFRSADPERYDIVTLGPSGAVTRIETPPHRSSSRLIWGCAAARAAALRALADESDPGDYLSSLCRRGGVAGAWLSDTYIDVGIKPALREALAEGGAPASATFEPRASA